MSFQQLTLENRPIENKPYRYITLDEQVRYSDFIEELGIFKDKLDNIKNCASEFYTYDCTHDPTHTKKVKYLNCGVRGICPRCSMSYARKRAEIMYQYVKQNLADNLDFDLKMNQIVLTLPKELHENLTELYASKIGDTITSVDIVDTENLIGRCVVAGNVRRSAALAMGKHDDLLYLEMKNDQGNIVKKEIFQYGKDERLLKSVKFYVKFIFGKIHEIPIEKTTFQYERW